MDETNKNYEYNFEKRELMYVCEYNRTNIKGKRGISIWS